jgi:hypothetical protein
VDFSSPYGPNGTANSAVTNASGGAQSTATAYASPGYDADATATAASSGDGAVTATATAIGGGAGSAIASTAYGSSDGGGPVKVTATAVGGSSVSATADGHSAGAGDVTVEASVDAPHPYAQERVDIALHDAVSGSTAGRLTLRELVGMVYDSDGDASASLHATNPGGGALNAVVGVRSGFSGDVVLGDILATSTTGADVSVAVLAVVIPGGGRVVQENRSPGETPTPSRIYAQSNGGAVKTSVSFIASPGRPGNSLEMVDVATGDTVGVLSLEQSAQGGYGLPRAFIAPGEFSPGGSGGSARSSLTKDTASSALELRSSARGGPAAFGPPSSGGNATAIASGSNSAGSARVFARAEGGDGVGSSAAGDAVVEASASTTGDGHDVVIGQEIPAFGSFTNPSFPVALGGTVFSCPGCPAGTIYARGGTASSRSAGTAAGDSLVTVFDLAVGGAGLSSTFNTAGGSGGDASSTATAVGGGASTVKAKSEARGGPGGQQSATEAGPGGGDADANASATGLGRVESWARAVGGNSVFNTSANPTPPVGPAGSAIARATADGATGFARAEALTGTSALPQLRAQSEALVGSRRDVAAAATHGAALASAPSDPRLEGSAFFTGAPLSEDVDAALAGNSALAAAFEGEGANMLALAHWTGDSGDDPLTLSTELELVMNTSESTNKLVLGAFGTSVLGDGFESLTLSLTKNGFSQRAVETFDTVDELMAFFTGTVLDLGIGWNKGDKFLAHFDLVLGAGTHFEMGLGYATAVPEPGTGLLLVFGLLVLARTRRRAAFSA